MQASLTRRSREKIILLAVCIAASAVAAAICFKKAHELSKGETLVSGTGANGTEWVKRLPLTEDIIALLPKFIRNDWFNGRHNPF